MSDIALTAVQVAPVYPMTADIVSVVLGEAVTQGTILYQTSTGTFSKADANGSGLQQARGVALAAGGAGQTISMLRRGECYGFTVSGMNADAIVYLSDTAGALADAAGTMTVNCGRITVVPQSGSAVKVIFFNFDWLRAWS